MKIRAGYEISYECVQPTPMLLMLKVHPSRQPDILTPEVLQSDPPVAMNDYIDGFGNRCTRLLAPPGRLTLSADFVIADSGEPDRKVSTARQLPVEELPDDVIVYLLGSRYCDTDKLADEAWRLFGSTPQGWARVQAICDYVNSHVKFGYAYARPTRTAWEGFTERLGVCRDFAHLAITFCRCMNIPARYVAGYLGDIGVPADPAPMDFSGWFEAYLEDGWHAFDARHNIPRIGRIVIGTGRDATDVAFSTSFGPTTLTGFRVITEEVAG